MVGQEKLIEIIKLRVRGYTQEEIAAMKELTLRTIQTYCTYINIWSNTSNRAEFIKWAENQGYIKIVDMS